MVGGIKEIKNHADVYYELAFAFDGKVEGYGVYFLAERGGVHEVTESSL